MVLWIRERDSLVMARLVSWLNLAAICHTLYSTRSDFRQGMFWNNAAYFQMWGYKQANISRGLYWNLLVQYGIKTVCCRSKDHFHWTAPCTPYTPLVPKVGDIGGTYQGLGGLAPQIFMNKLFQTKAKTTIEATVSTNMAKRVFHTHRPTHAMPSHSAVMSH